MNLREQAEKLIEQDNYPEAAKLLSKHLDSNPEDPKALFLIGYCFMKTEGMGLAMNVFHRAGQLFPGEAAIWHNIGKLYHDLNDDDKAEEYFRKALKIDNSFANSLEGLGMVHLNRGDFNGAIHYCNRALAENTSVEARINRGMAYLALKRWREGWPDYNANVGKDKNRVVPTYNGEPAWDGTNGLNVVVFGEQGLGDEISFASCIPDLVRDCKTVILECDGRLEKLFKRSFDLETWGTRYKGDASWKTTRKFDAHVAVGQLAQYYRNQDSDFPGTPYLKPNPQMAMQWRVLLDSLGKRPKIGISWTGGLLHTGLKKRSVTLDTFAPLFKEIDAEWVSLQYKEPEVKEAEEKYGVKINDFDWGTRVYDYDQTAALVSELDLVISVTTSVVQLAAGLGKDCYCLVPSKPIWRYMEKGDELLWGRSVKLLRQKGREWPIYNLLGELRDRGWAKHRASQAAA